MKLNMPIQSDNAVAAISQRLHLPALDGLRGLAILMVMILHFGGATERSMSGANLWFSRLTGAGWCGVDLFFVLSGFLITGILFDAKGTGNALRNFYARRVLRIFPLYYGTLLVLFVLLPLVARGATTPGLDKVAHQQGWLWLYVSNFASVYIGDKTFTAGLVQSGHFWSLAIEEQFYLVWPLLVLTLQRRTLINVCAAVIIGVLGLRLGLVAQGFERIYFFTPARLDGLMAGAMLSLILRGGTRVEALVPTGRNLFLACGAALAAIWAIRGLDSYDWPISTVGFTLLAGFFAASIILVLAAPQPSLRTRIFHGNFLRFFGKYSYGLYVFHCALEPTFRHFFSVNILIDRVFHHYWPARIAYMSVSIGLSIAAAMLSWHLYEKQFLKLKRHFEVAPPQQDALAQSEQQQIRIAA
jgi:peptidoglycan/LPS O-acetylase OafA/YrhL